ncbi:AAA family ATPase [Arthrobacter sp. MAHUQ-56]
MNTESPLRLKSSLVGLRSNSGPLKDVAVTFGPDVTALYGRNGAGKTWILNALRNSMRGYYHKGMTQLLCEFERGSAVFDWALQELSYHMRERRYSTLATLEEDRALLHRAIEEWFVRGGRYLRPYEDEDEIPAELVNELVHATAIAFVPIGSSAPEWDVWLCVPEDASRFPAFVRALDEFRAETKQVDELERQMKLLDPELNAGESDELTEEEYIARQEEVERLLDEAVQRAWSYIYEPVMGWLWNYSYQPDPDHVRNWMSWMTSDDLPIPVVKLFTARNTPLVLEDEDDLSDLNIATAQAFSEHFQKELGVAEDGLVLSDAMRDWATGINAAANDIYAALLQDAPALTLEVLQPGRWVTEGALQWYVDHGSEYRQVKVPFSALSRAESRWARVAVRRALDVTGSASALIIDEPEAALHRVAEKHMARGLDRLTAMGPQVVVATHSSEVLDTHSTRCVHVTKRAGQTSVGQLPSIEPAHLAELGYPRPICLVSTGFSSLSRASTTRS